MLVRARSKNAGTAGNNIATVSYTTDGNLRWSKVFDGTAHGNDVPVALALDSRNSAYVLGRTNSLSSSADFVTIKYSDSGNQRWIELFDRGFARADLPADIAVDGRGKVYATGTSEQDNSLFTDFVTIKYTQWLSGDADNSGIINVSDAVFLLNYIFHGGPTPAESYLGDTDCDGDIDLADVIALINYIFAGWYEPCSL